MAANTQFVTESIVRNANLPAHGGRYSVIPHSFIIDETRKELSNLGINITRELYKINRDGQIAQGIYHLDVQNDPEMGMMFAWSNSYNKMMKFKCAVGAQVFICMNGVVAGDMASYARKHVGQTAMNDAIQNIQSQLSSANTYYTRLIEDKNMLKNISLSRKEQSSLVGRLFCDEEILTPTQTSIVKKEIHNPSFNYNCSNDSAWALYNHVTLALKESHPISYLSDHQKVHDFFVNEFGQLVTPQIMDQPMFEEVSQVVNEFEADVLGVNFL
jgi:hypothetical protein